jgi:hypothetical protein
LATWLAIQICPTRALALLGDPDARAYELLFSFRLLKEDPFPDLVLLQYGSKSCLRLVPKVVGLLDLKTRGTLAVHCVPFFPVLTGSW